MRWERIAVLRTVLLTLAGLGALTAAGFLLAEWIGWAVFGVALLTLEWLTRPGEGGQ